jgi:hypothetical protein
MRVTGQALIARRPACEPACFGPALAKHLFDAPGGLISETNVFNLTDEE